MLTLLLIISFTLFGVLTPLFFWTINSRLTGKGFQRLILGLSTISAGMGVVLYWFMDLDFHVRLPAVVWFVSLLAVTQFYWSREYVQNWVVSIPSILGSMVYFQMLGELVVYTAPLMFISIVGGLILSASIFAMILGHWYLNMNDLPIGLLKKAVNCLIFFLIIRNSWDVYFLLSKSLEVDGNIVSLIGFIQSYNGYFLFFALFFGTVLPLILSIFVLKTVAVQSTQSAMGLLYVLVLSVTMGDLFYKFYFFHYGLFL